MPKIRYREGEFYSRQREKAEAARDICERYAAQGVILTSGQVYYRMVVEKVIENTPSEYRELPQLLTNARYYGLIDWDHICGDEEGEKFRSPSIYCDSGDLIMETWISVPSLSSQADEAILYDDSPVPLTSNIHPIRRNLSTGETWMAAMRLKLKVMNGVLPLLWIGDASVQSQDLESSVIGRLLEFIGGDVRPLKRMQIPAEDAIPYPVQVSAAPRYDLESIEPGRFEELVRAAVTGAKEIWNG